MLKSSRDVSDFLEGKKMKIRNIILKDRFVPSKLDIIRNFPATYTKKDVHRWSLNPLNITKFYCFSCTSKWNSKGCGSIK